MAQIEGKHTCEECRNSFGWYYPIPNDVSDLRYDVNKPDPEKAWAKNFEGDSKKPEKLLAKCTHCGSQNSIKLK